MEIAPGQQKRNHQAGMKAWEERQAAFFEKQRLNNEGVEKQRAAYVAGSADAVTEYCDMVLSASDYPDYFPQEFSLDYNRFQCAVERFFPKMLVVRRSMPKPASAPITTAAMPYRDARLSASPASHAGNPERTTESGADAS